MSTRRRRRTARICCICAACETGPCCHGFERERLARLVREFTAATAAQHAAILSSNRFAEQVLASTVSEAQVRRAERDTKCDVPVCLAYP